MIELRRILVPTDFSKYSNAGLVYARALAEKFGAEIYLLHVTQDLALFLPEAVAVVPPFAMPIEQFTVAARNALDRLVRENPMGNLTVHCDVREGVPFHEIIRFARQNEIDLIVIGTHGHTGL